MTFDELIKLFQGNETPEAVFAIMDDQILRGAFLAWKSIIIMQSNSGEDVPDDIENIDDSRAWQWLWENFKFDYQKLAIVSGVQSHEIHNFVERLIGLRLVYPDGSQNNYAVQYLHSQIVTQLKKANR